MTAPPLRILAHRIEVGDADLPHDRFSDHVNNARYFAFMNATFWQWYVAMGIRERGLSHAAMMARIEYDFLREVRPPGVIECRIEVVRVGRASMTHAVEILDLGRDGSGEPVLAGRGRATHVWVDRSTRRAAPWPPALLAKCWDGEVPAG